MRNPLLLLLVTAAFAPCSVSVAQSPLSAADSARADLPLIRRADAARTRGAGPASAIDTLRPTIHEFVDHACPSCRAFVMARGDSLTQLAATSRANLVLRVSPIPGLLRGAHAAEAAFCAGALGGAAAFDQLNRTLLEQQDAWRHRRDPAPEFRRLAVSAGLDSAQFERCLHSGAMRPLVMSDARLAGQLAVDGTPTLLVTRRNGAARAVRVVGEATMSRIARAVSAAEEDAMEEPAAYALVGRWRLDSMELFRWAPDSTTKVQQTFRDARQTAARTAADIRAGSLIIETVFEPTLRYTHTLRRGDRTVYSEAGAWAVPGLTGKVQVMTDTGDDGTYHETRIVARDGGTLVLERHFTSGGSRGTGERLFLTRQPADGAAPGAAPHRD